MKHLCILHTSDSSFLDHFPDDQLYLSGVSCGKWSLIQPWFNHLFVMTHIPKEVQVLMKLKGIKFFILPSKSRLKPMRGGLGQRELICKIPTNHMHLYEKYFSRKA